MTNHTPDSPTIQIPITQGFVAIVDQCDADLALLNWHVSVPSSTRYAVRNTTTAKGQRLQQMHRIILSRKLGRKLKKNEFVDHANRDTFDNRRENLRLATRSQNGYNRPKPVSNTSGYKGVRWDKKYQCWRAVIQVDRELVKLGRHETAIDAANAYNRAALKYHRQFAHLNVIEEHDDK